MNYKKYRIYIILLFFIFSQNILFSQSTLKNYLIPKNIDTSLFRTINNSRNNFLSSVIPLTDKSVFPSAFLLPIGLFTYSRLNKNYYDENSAILAGFSEIAGTAVTLAIKNLFKRERPFRELKNVYYDDKNSPTDRYAFPSNHTNATFAMATALTLRYPDKPVLIVGSYLYASIVAYGRIYLGVHYPADVLGGIIVGSGSAVLIYSLRKQMITFKNNLFKEKDNKDKNENSNSTSFILLSLVGTDLLNFVIYSTGSKMSESLKINFSASGNINSLNLNYNF